jgi:hypothetical protein
MVKPKKLKTLITRRLKKRIFRNAQEKLNELKRARTLIGPEKEN